MKLLVLGLAAFASSVVPAREDVYGDRRARQAGADQAGERQVVLPGGGTAEVAVEPSSAFTNDGISAGPDPGEVEAGTADGRESTEVRRSAAGAGAWEVACRIKGGSELLFDRASLREYG